MASAWVGLFAMGVVPVIHVTGLLGFAAYSAIDSARVLKVRHNGRNLLVYRADLRDTNLVATDTPHGWGLSLKHSYKRVVLAGDEAHRVTTRLLARANGTGASRALLGSSTARLLQAESLGAFVRTTAAYSESLSDEYAVRKQEYRRAFERSVLTPNLNESRNPGSLSLLAPHTRLALEMALHEESERVALAGELAPLIAAWREAEEIAGIADALLVPPAVDAQLDTMRRRVHRDGETQKPER